MDDRIALFDLDGTLVSGWLIFPWVEHLAENLPGLEARSLQDLPAEYLGGRISHDDFAADAAQRYASLTAPLPETTLRQMAREFVDAALPRALFPYVQPFLHGLRRASIEPLLITGAPEPVALEVASHLGVSRVAALRSRRGEVIAMPGTATGKALAIAQLAGGAGAHLAAGDSASDMPLFEAARRRLLVGSRVEAPESWAGSARTIDPHAVDVDDLVRWASAP